METRGVSSAVVSALRIDLAEHIASLSRRPFDGANIQMVEKRFVETIGQSGTSGLRVLFTTNDESSRAVVHAGRKHYRKYLAVGRYLTLLGEIHVRRGIYQSNQENRSICPLELSMRQ